MAITSKVKNKIRIKTIWKNIIEEADFKNATEEDIIKDIKKSLSRQHV